jgi:hypothetical protein
VRAVLHELRRQLRERFEGRLPARRLVDLDGRLALLGLDGDRHDLLGQTAFVGRLDRQLMAAQCPAVHVRPGQLQLGRNLAGLLHHVLAGERVRQPVLDHPVDRLGIAHAVAEARIGQQVRRVRHALHAARDAGVEVAGPDGRVDQPDRADARRADLVDRLGGHVLGNAALDLRLARRDLALPGLEHLAHHHLVDLSPVDLRALERRSDRRATQVGGVEACEGASQLAERCAGGAEDHGLWHV